MDSMGAAGGRWSNPRWNYPEYPPGSVVEVRVHGIGGEPPSSMTRDPHPVLVGGDEIAGFYRARDPVLGPVAGADALRDAGRRARLHVREVLSWGGQTSGSIRHAFWVLLLPFAIFNVAGRMHDVTSAARAARHRAVCRVLALTMTLAVVAIACGVAFDLVAVQCGSWGATCLGTEADGPALLGPFRRHADDVVGRLGLAAMLPVVLLIALWYSGRYRTRTLEGFTADVTATVRRRHDEPTSLADHDFWRNAWPASRLRGLHATAGFALVGLTLTLSLHAVKAHLGAPAGVWLWLAAFEAVVVIASLVAAWMPGMATPGPDRGLHVLLLVLRAVGVGILAFAVGFAALGQVTEGRPAAAWWGWPTVGAAVAAGALLWWVERARRQLPPREEDVAALGEELPDVSIGIANLPLAGAFLLLGWILGVTATGDWGDTGALTDPALGAVPEALAWIGSAGRLMPGVFVPAYLPLLAVVCVQALLVVWLFADSVGATPPLREGRSEFDDDGPVPFNLTAVLATLLSFLLITAIGAGLHTVVLDALGERSQGIEEPAGRAPPSSAGADGASTSETGGDADAGGIDDADEEEEAELTLPWWHAATALVLAGMLLLAGLGVGAQIWLRRGLRPDPRIVAGHLDPEGTGPPWGPDPTAKADVRRLRDIGKGWMVQRLIRDGGVVLTWVVLLTLVLTGVVIYGAVEPGLGGPLPFTTPAVWLVSAIPVVAVLAVRRSLQDRATRRDIGRLWDVLTFWPRVTHPFAPPCYGEAVVPMLEHRVRLLLDAPEGYGVVLAGHSQGSVVSLAAAARLGSPPTSPPEPTGGRLPTPPPDHDQRSRLALVTYGSPIAILYERYFPATLRLEEGSDATVFEHVRDRVHTWHHLFALTEPFAYPFWATDPPPVVDGCAAVKGWSLARLLPRIGDEGCPACRAPDADGFRRTVDLLVADPDRWRLPDGSPTLPAGHSAYHRHRDVDRHLGDIAASLTTADQGVDDELRSAGWWRTGP